MQTELTMIAVPSRDIPLPVIREQVEDRMACALNDRLGSEVSPETLATLVQLGAAINSKFRRCCAFFCFADCLVNVMTAEFDNLYGLDHATSSSTSVLLLRHLLNSSCHLTTVLSRFTNMPALVMHSKPHNVSAKCAIYAIISSKAVITLSHPASLLYA